MTLNPLHFAEAVKKQYLRYQLTSARLTDEVLAEQFEDKLWHTLSSPLFKGPFVSLSRAYEEGSKVADLIDEGLLHQRMQRIVPYEHLYRHQEDAVRAIEDGRDVLITTGTGSGKTEAFLYPIIDRCLELQEDPDAAEGVTALIVYPMNALATDQLDRLREYLVGTGVDFGLYVGPTPEDDEGAWQYEGRRVPKDMTREEFEDLKEETADQDNVVHWPREERVTREEIRDDPPRILLVNKAILEFQLTRGRDLDLFLDAPIEFLVMDEAHTNTGATGAEVAMLLRRVKALADPPQGRVTNIATSATIVDPEHDDEGQRFMARLFGVEEDNVEIVREVYQGLDWPDDDERASVSMPPDPRNLLERALDAVAMDPGPDRDRELEAVFQDLTGEALPSGDTIQSRLFKGFLQNEFAYQLQSLGTTVRGLDDLVDEVWTATGRGPQEKGAREEILTYLVLGAMAEREETPLFRPKLHYFAKGLEGAVAVLHEGNSDRAVEPELFLNADKAKDKWGNRRDETAFFPVKVCPQCGQHHYEQYLEDVTSAENEPLAGGQQTGDGTVFHPDAERTQARILFTDVPAHGDEETDGFDSKRYADGQICRSCGAIHRGAPSSCGRCERTGTLLPIYILDEVDKVKSCPVCKYRQGVATKYYPDPFRALREITVANVYVLAQDMLNQAEGESKRLIVFADNRQEAAFQAGWMQDRARRYRFRQLLYQHLPDPEEADEAPGQAEISLTEIIENLTETLKEDKALAQSLAPEVFEQVVEEAYGRKFEEALERFLTVQVLREVTATYRTRASLETWGKLRVHYWGIDPTNEAVQTIGARYNVASEELTSWLRNLLDTIRKRRMLHHQRHPIFSRAWGERYDLVKNQYLPPIDFYPEGMRLQRRPDEDTNDYTKVWLGKSLTGIEDWARRLDIEEDRRKDFLQDIWNLLVDDLELLTQVDALTWPDGTPIKGTQNVYQLSAHRIGVTQQDERYRCNFCGRIHPRDTPGSRCTRWRCTDGRVEPLQDEEPRDYDLVLLESADTFVLPAEHTAQVPDNVRDEIERQFKEGEGVNCLVATPTLELGVDIGALDMVLMRNVPPRPANYWQRAGRAGRRNRMAVIVSYVRANPHDVHFFKQPTKLLGGAVRPPNFNLENPVMVQKHVHAAVLTQLHAELVQEDESWIKTVIPTWIGNVVFGEDRRPRESLDEIIEPLEDALSDPTRKQRLLDVLTETFSKAWPDDPDYVSREQLETYLDEMPEQLRTAYDLVLRRLNWAWRQKQRLAQKELEEGELTGEEERFRRRCKDTIDRLRPSPGPEGKMDPRTYTLSVLSREGFLPGYADTRDHVVATAERAYSRTWERFDFDLTRPKSIAIHEHLPGNRIYANGGEYQLSHFKLPALEELKNPPEWYVNQDTGSVKNVDEADAGYHDPNAKQVRSLPLVDSQLSFVSHVEDEEETRFRMPSVVSGSLRRRHDGGRRYEFDDHLVEHRDGQFLTLMNLGPNSEEITEVGFPICRVCGGIRSPYADEERIEDFYEYHKERCGKTPEFYGLHVNIEVDGLLFEDFETQGEAVSLGEALTLIGTHLFEMERGDLRWVALPEDEDEWRLFLYDPMPGGSGLLEQFLDEWSSVLQGAHEVLEGCPSGCSNSCYDCLRTYYNQFFHEMLDRHVALERLEEMGKEPVGSNPIEPIDEIPDLSEDGQEENPWEKRLRSIVTDEWGFHGFAPQVRVELPDANAHTTPDLAHENAEIAIYLDGPHHSEPGQKQKDRFLRQALRTKGWDVIEIQIEDLENERMLEMYQREIGAKLERR